MPVMAPFVCANQCAIGVFLVGKNADFRVIRERAFGQMMDVLLAKCFGKGAELPWGQGLVPK